MTEQLSSMMHTLALYPQSELHRTNHLLGDYLVGDPRACEFFSHDPDEINSIARTARAQANRAALAGELVSFQQTLGANQLAIDYAQLLADPETPVITTGQQCGLLTGPLYTIFKAISTINMARRLTATLGRTVVPVFWAATDDNDRSEVDHCCIWDQHNILHTLHYPETFGAPGQLIGNLPIDEVGAEILTSVQAMIEGLPYASLTNTLLQETLRESTDLGNWFARLLSRFLSHLGLVLCDPRLPVVRYQGQEIIRREIMLPLQSTALINRRAQELHQRGYHAQLTKPADVCNFFYYDGVRHRVSYNGTHFCFNGQTKSPDEILQLLKEHPEQFTPNAVLRPVVQEYLLGSATFVAGPNELGYWAELAPVFELFNIEMPPVTPRAAATLVPPAIARIIQHLHLAPLQVLYDYDQVRLSILEKVQPRSIAHGFDDTRADIERRIATLVELVTTIDPTLKQSALATHQRMLNELERFERKTLKAIERHSSEHTDRLERVRKIIFPRRGLQERLLNIMGLYARYGPDFLTQLAQQLDEQEGRHIFVEL